MLLVTLSNPPAGFSANFSDSATKLSLFLSRTIFLSNLSVSAALSARTCRDPQQDSFRLEALHRASFCLESRQLLVLEKFGSSRFEGSLRRSSVPK